MLACWCAGAGCLAGGLAGFCAWLFNQPIPGASVRVPSNCSNTACAPPRASNPRFATPSEALPLPGRHLAGLAHTTLRHRHTHVELVACLGQLCPKVAHGRLPLHEHGGLQRRWGISSPSRSRSQHYPFGGQRRLLQFQPFVGETNAGDTRANALCLTLRGMPAQSERTTSSGSCPPDAVNIGQKFPDTVRNLSLAPRSTTKSCSGPTCPRAFKDTPTTRLVAAPAPRLHQRRGQASGNEAVGQAGPKPPTHPAREGCQSR